MVQCIFVNIKSDSYKLNANNGEIIFKSAAATEYTKKNHKSELIVVQLR